MGDKSAVLTIGQLLLKEGAVTPEQLDRALAQQKEAGGYLCANLIKLGFVSEEQIFPVLARQLKVPYIRLKDAIIPPEVIKTVPAKFATHYRLIPVKLEGGTLSLAMADPLDVHTLDDMRLFLGYDIKPMLAGDTDIVEAISRYYGVGADTLEEIVAGSEKIFGRIEKEGRAAEDVEVQAEDASIVKFVNQILAQAVSDRATDIHLEPYENELKVRFRIDGMLYDVNIPETIRYFHSAIISRIKIMAHLNIAEHRLPQDGRIKIRVKDIELDLRVSIVPSSFGEAVVIRILSGKEVMFQLDSLGLSKEESELLSGIIKRPHGIILVTGPTGSGKTTTLYAFLSELNKKETKIITIEDPIEYQISGIIQMQVHPKIGFDFANGLRSILRHDPDIIMVGEIRDYETAEIAIRSSLTGHLVFSTLHTNDAAGAVTRLLDMELEPFLVASSIECLIAQRLVRLICPHCKKEARLSEEAAQILKKDIDVPRSVFYAGSGCEKCKHTGYQGRTAIYEILVMDNEVRDLILKRSSSQQIKQAAISKGMTTLRQAGLRKATQGITTIEEVLRVTQKEEMFI
ncbi:MAG: type II secretion system ATPase GspE [Candidatus Omnitrophica bacterium]|nr:type II secretion system ATPase GspE [Candidatus Omnitrophota bacterium]